MKLYLSSLIAYNSKTGMVGYSPFLFWADCYDHAVGKAINLAYSKWPLVDNWYNHQENTVLVPDGTLDKILDNYEQK